MRMSWLSRAPNLFYLQEWSTLSVHMASGPLAVPSAGSSGIGGRRGALAPGPTKTLWKGHSPSSHSSKTTHVHHGTVGNLFSTFSPESGVHGAGTEMEELQGEGRSRGKGTRAAGSAFLIWTLTQAPGMPGRGWKAVSVSLGSCWPKEL